MYVHKAIRYSRTFNVVSLHMDVLYIRVYVLMYTLKDTLFEISIKTTFISPPLKENFIIHQFNKKKLVLNI